MAELWFETHSTTTDNEAGRATGWLSGKLSDEGRLQAQRLAERVAARSIRRVYASDLPRAVETVRIAAAGLPIVLDWRLRECNYGRWNGAPTRRVHDTRLKFLDDPYPGGESWREAANRVGRFLDDLRASAPDGPLLVVGHMATRLGLDHHLAGMPLEEWLTVRQPWQPGWLYHL